MHLDLIDLRLFLLVTEAGSITEGAVRAGLALASASARVRGMEDQVGVPLLERSRRGVRPTPAGYALLHHAKLVMQQVERMRGDLGEYAHGMKGHIRVLANTAASAEILPELLAKFLAEHPNIDVDLNERPSIAVAQAVAEGLADIGVAAAHADFTGLETFPFRQDRLVLAVPLEHALAGRERASFAEALKSNFIGLAGDSALHQHLVGHATRVGGNMRIRVRAAGVDVICRMVALGAGIAVLPEAAARRWEGHREFSITPLEDAWAERRLEIVVQRIDTLPSQARRLVEHLLQPVTAC